MQGKSGDKVRLQHILDAIEEIETYLSANNIEVFMENSMMRFACIKQLEIIGEATNHIWAQIIGMRNVFVHEYFGVDSNLVWQIIKDDLPQLKKNVLTILDSVR
jgi:uncharacterized protein with HEPN domain